MACASSNLRTLRHTWSRSTTVVRRIVDPKVAGSAPVETATRSKLKGYAAGSYPAGSGFDTHRTHHSADECKASSALVFSETLAGSSPAIGTKSLSLFLVRGQAAERNRHPLGITRHR